jgi:hypothetical protein
LRVKLADHTPDFISIGVKVDEGGCEFKAIYRRKLHANLFLDVEADDMDLIVKFQFELVNDGL